MGKIIQFPITDSPLLPPLPVEAPSPALRMVGSMGTMAGFALFVFALPVIFVGLLCKSVCGPAAN